MCKIAETGGPHAFSLPAGGRSMTRDGVLDAIYELAGLQAPQEGEAGHRGHPLSAQPVGAVPLFYVA